MQLPQSVLYIAFLISSTVALPNGAAINNPGLACVVPPYLYGCGSGLSPQCCTFEEYEDKFGHPPTTTIIPTITTPTITSTALSSISTTLAARGVGPACVVAPYLYGCGTSLLPRCCTYEEYEQKFGHPPPSAAASSTAAAASASVTIYQ